MKNFTRSLLIEIREVVFGLEDGMVSTLGAITGIAGASGNRSLVIVAGLVVVAVESLSMAAGTYLSNKSETDATVNHSYLKKFQTRFFASRKSPVIDALYMGASYVIGGSIALFPYWFFDIGLAIPLSVASVVASLFLLGYQSAKLTGAPRFRSAVEMATISLSAALLGFVVGKVAALFFPGIPHG